MNTEIETPERIAATPAVGLHGVVMRRVVKSEYVGACRYTGYIAKSIQLTLECGHEQFRKASQGIPLKAKCRECQMPNNVRMSDGGHETPDLK